MTDSIIKIQNLTHIYPRGEVRALDNINLNIKSGDVVSIIGQNGSGKTTLVRHFNGLLRPTEGKIFIDSEDMENVSSYEMSKKCGYVFQNPNHQIFNETVRKELLVGPKNYKMSKEETKDSLEYVVELLNIENILDKHPMTLDYTTKKILTIASILIYRPEIVVLDEPTGGLDEIGRRSLSNVINILNKEGRTVIIISHDMDYVAENSKSIVVMAKAKVLAEGKPKDIFAKEDILKQAQVEPPQITILENRLFKNKELSLSVDDFVNKYKY